MRNKLYRWYNLVTLSTSFAYNEKEDSLKVLASKKRGPNYPYNGWQKWVADEHNTWDPLGT